MAHHLLSRPSLNWDEQRFLFKKKSTASEGSSMADPKRERERGLGGAELQIGASFLKNNRISLAYGLTSNVDPSFISKVALFSCCFVFL